MSNVNLEKKQLENQRTFNLKSFLAKYGLFVILVLMVILMWILSPDFMTIGNILNITKQVTMNGLLAIGMTFVIIAGGIDLSVGSMVALSSIVAGSVLTLGPDNTTFTVLALVAGMFACGIFGFLNGAFISFLKMPPFIVTLAFMTIIRGVGYVYCDGNPYVIRADAFRFYGQGTIFGIIPVPVIILLIVFVIFFFILHGTKFGRHVYATGGNENAALTSGVNTTKVKLIVYTISGALAGMGGIILGSRINSGNPTLGTGYELDAIAAVVIGGASLSGGVGNLVGTILGVFTFGVINNAMNLLGVSSYYQMIAKGVIILLAVLMDSRTKKMGGGA